MLIFSTARGEEDRRRRGDVKGEKKFGARGEA